MAKINIPVRSGGSSEGSSSEDFKGFWDASGSAPDEPSSSGYFVVNVAGTTEVGGYTGWKVGDMLVWTMVQWIPQPSGSSAIVAYDEGVSQGTVTELNVIGEDIELRVVGNRANIYSPVIEYVSHFHTSDGSTNSTVADFSTTSRYISSPTSEGVPFGIGDWSGGESHSAIQSSSFAMSTNDYFSIYGTSSTLTVTVYGASGGTLATHVVVLSGDYSQTTENINIVISNFGVDNPLDTFKSKALFNLSVNISSLLPNGGRFSVKVVHYNSGDGSYTKEQNNVFYDPNSVSSSIGSVTVSESVGLAVTRRLSGKYCYIKDSAFSVQVNNINNLNNSTYPANMIGLEGSELNLPSLNLGGSDLTSWTNVYNNSGTSYLKSNWAIANDNIFVLSVVANVNARTIDWSNGSYVASNNLSVLIDSYVGGSSTLSEGFNTETGRLKSDLSTSWDSSQSLLTYDSGTGLEVKGSYLVYPATNYTPYSPSSTLQPNYSGTSGDKFWYSDFNDSGVAHSNGIFSLTGTSLTEGNFGVKFTIEISLDGVNWYDASKDYGVGSLSDGDGCRINPGTVDLEGATGEVQFTLGEGGYTDASSGLSGWGVFWKITYADSTVTINNFSIDW